MISFNSHPPSDAPVVNYRQSFVAVPRRKGFFQTLRAHFPEGSSQVALILTLICAIAVSAVWLWWILDTRWLEQQRNPTTVLTRERVTSIQMIEAISINFPPDYFGEYGQNMPFHLVEAFHNDYTSSTRLSSDYIRCPDVFLYGHDAVCQPYIAGQEAYPATLSGQPRLDVTNWPLQYHNRGDTLQLNVHALLNTSGVVPLSFKQPHVDAFILSAEQLITAKDLTYNGTVPSFETFLPYLNSLPRYVAMQFGYQYDMGLTLTKRVDVNGETEFDWTMSESISPLLLSDAQIENLWSQMLSNLPAADQTRLTNLRATTDIVYFPVVIALAPSSFDGQLVQVQNATFQENLLQVITSKVMYGFLGFVSDVGGFLNVLALAFTVIFPFSHALIRPRVFLPFYFYRLVRSGALDKLDQQRLEIEKQQVEKEEALAAAASTTNGSGATEMVQVGDVRDTLPVDNDSVDIQVQPL